MKALLRTISILIFMGFTACEKPTEEILQVRNASISDFPVLSPKKPIVRMAYDMELVTRNDFGGSEYKPSGMMNTDIPHKEKKKVFYEVYDDYTIGYAIELLKPASGDANDWSKTERFRLIKVYDGMMKVFDQQDKLLLSEPTRTHSIDKADLIASDMGVADYLKAKVFKPAQAFEVTKKILTSAATFTTVENGLRIYKIPGRNQTDPQYRNTQSNYTVTYNELTYNEDYGIPIKEEGFNHNGEVVDRLSYYYTEDGEGGYVMNAQQYTKKVYSAAEDVEYLSVTDYFYDNFQFENL